ncbi:hypothetical protein PGH47_42580 (plasmid) [Streptomyces sp. HUAS 31]|uniref:hypothetical protein n=1 Tax=Streptomyces sp. HUAS 31 TaxID=3020055 RepID=UPI00230562DB|nr:hypothetical protein [Streptomyces sp. HUAS 31]WCE02437.1 hypothetical protein PGH47_42580 [Streptomyces sp. HUAS 31]
MSGIVFSSGEPPDEKTPGEPAAGPRKGGGMRRKKSGSTAVCTVLVMTLWMTGCGGEASDQEKSTGGNSASDSREKSNDCLREKGAEVKSGQTGGPGQILPGEMSAKEFQQALKDCKVGGGKSGGGMSQQAKEQMLAFAECMRKEGFDVPDPKFANGAAQIPRMEVPDSRKDEYQAASDACAQALG